MAMSDKKQKQETIPLELKDGKQYVAVRYGNNAAWMCVCGYRLPLIWSALHKNMPTVCDGCGRSFLGEGKPDIIRETI